MTTKETIAELRALLGQPSPSWRRVHGLLDDLEASESASDEDVFARDAREEQIERIHAAFDDCEREWTNLHDLGECCVAMARSHSTCCESQGAAQNRIAVLEAENAALREVMATMPDRLRERAALLRERSRFADTPSGAIMMLELADLLADEADAMRKEGK